MSKYQIRLAEISDISKIAEIWMEGVNEQLNKDENYIICDKEMKRIEEHFRFQILSQSKNFPFWVYVNSDVAGWSCLSPFHPTPHINIHNSYSIVSTYVAKKEQGNGIGTALMEYTISEAHKTDIKYILGIQLQKNIRSVKMCSNNKFVNLGELPKRNDIPIFDMIVHNVK